MVRRFWRQVLLLIAASGVAAGAYACGNQQVTTQPRPGGAQTAMTAAITPVPPTPMPSISQPVETPPPCCTDPTRSTARHHITGTVVVAGEGNFRVLQGPASPTCRTTDRVPGIGEGVLIIAASEIGGIAGEDDLSPGKVIDGACVFQFQMSEVPETAEYRFALYEPSQHPTSVTYTLEEMESNNWTVHLQAVCMGSVGTDPLIGLVRREGVPPDEPANC